MRRPPLSAQEPLLIRIQAQDFDVATELKRLGNGGADVGAVVTFLGRVRGRAEGSNIQSMTLEYYPGMTEKALEKIVAEAHQRWNLLDALLLHRVGTLRPGDQIVLVAVAATHRGEAFAACEFIVDYVKTRAPFWKKEQTSKGARWVAARRSDREAAQRWGGKPPAKDGSA